MRIAVMRSSELAADPSLLSAAERDVLATIRGPRRRDEWIRGRLAIRSVLPGAITLVDADGAPRLVHGDGHETVDPASPIPVSLSHDGDWIAVAVAKEPVGIDLCLRDHSGRIAKILRWLAVTTDVEPVVCWAALEAVLKLRRLSIEQLRDRALDVRADGDDILVRGIGDDAIVHVASEPDFVVGWTLEAAA